MTIEISDATVGMWSVQLPGGNWLAHLGRLDDGHTELTYRFRWYVDEKDFDSADKKNWYCFRTKHPNDAIDDAKLLEMSREVFRRLTDAGHHGWELMRGERPADDFARLLMTMPGMVAREERAA